MSSLRQAPSIFCCRFGAISSNLGSNANRHTYLRTRIAPRLFRSRSRRTFPVLAPLWSRGEICYSLSFFPTQLLECLCPLHAVFYSGLSCKGSSVPYSRGRRLFSAPPLTVRRLPPFPSISHNKTPFAELRVFFFWPSSHPVNSRNAPSFRKNF